MSMCMCIFMRVAWIVLLMWMSHVTHVNESCHTCEWIMSHMWMHHVTHVNVSCHTCECVMSHIWMGHVTHVNESCHTCEWVMSHIWRSHVTHMNESCHTYQWVKSEMWMRHVPPFTCGVLGTMGGVRGLFSETSTKEPCNDCSADPMLGLFECSRTVEDTLEWVVAHKWVMTRIWMSVGTLRVKESWHIYG